MRRLYEGPFLSTILGTFSRATNYFNVMVYPELRGRTSPARIVVSKLPSLPFYSPIPLVAAIPARLVDRFRAFQKSTVRAPSQGDFGPLHLPVCDTATHPASTTLGTTTPQLGTSTIAIFQI